MPRRNPILLEQRERIIRAFEDTREDYLMVADTIGVNRSTARSMIVARYIREGQIAESPRGGANNVRVENEMKDCLNVILNDHFRDQELKRRFPRKPRIHNRTVARTLGGMLLRFKIARRQPAERNRPDVIQKRHDYANWFMGQAIVRHTGFVDGCEHNIWTARSQGRAIRGEWAYRQLQVCGQRGKNLTVALAISPTAGLVFQSAVTGGMDAQTFADFLAQTRLHLDPDEQVIFFYDGAPAHHNPGNAGLNTQLKKLPPYSPFLNILEQAISSLKVA